VRADPAFEIKKLTKKLAVDLVIVGSLCSKNVWVSLRIGFLDWTLCFFLKTVLSPLRKSFPEAVIKSG
jgi:hypothetical protein